MQEATPLFDMWALGVTAYRMMAGKLPYEQFSDSKREAAIRNNDRQPLPTIYSAELRGLADKLLEPDQSKRPLMEEVLREPIVRAELNKIMNDFIELTKSYETSEQAHMFLEKVVEIQWVIVRTPYYGLVVDKSLLRIANTEESEFLAQSEQKAINDGLQFCEEKKFEFPYIKGVYRGYINEQGEE